METVLEAMSRDRLYIPDLQKLVMEDGSTGKGKEQVLSWMKETLIRVRQVVERCVSYANVCAVALYNRTRGSLMRSLMLCRPAVVVLAEAQGRCR